MGPASEIADARPRCKKAQDRIASVGRVSKTAIQLRPDKGTSEVGWTRRCLALAAVPQLGQVWVGCGVDCGGVGVRRSAVAGELGEARMRHGGGVRS